MPSEWLGVYRELHQEMYGGRSLLCPALARVQFPRTVQFTE
jgi:hypothetical protein